MTAGERTGWWFRAATAAAALLYAYGLATAASTVQSVADVPLIALAAVVVADLTAPAGETP